MNKNLYKMRIVEGSLINKDSLKKFPNRILENLGDLNWGNLIEATLNLEEIKDIQKLMIKHYQDPVPWYMDGVNNQDPNMLICAFGADDGENGKIFIFNKNDKETYQEIIEYGVSKGIPREQLDFND